MKLTYWRQTIRPRYRFATSQGGVDEKEVIIVSIEHDGIAGFGEVVASELYGQTLDLCEEALDAMSQHLGDDPFQIGPIIDRLIEHHDEQRAAISGVDAALHDWVGRRLGVPVWRLLGLPPAEKHTTFTIGIAELDLIEVKVKEAVGAGFDALKVKVGTDHDHETLSIVRQWFNGPLYLDANQGWTPENAIDKINEIAQFRPTLIEQPLTKRDWQFNAKLRESGVAPIFADESCERPADVLRLHGYVDGVNIKFTKCGGIREALRMITLARALGMQTMLGCFVCSSLAIAPALAIAPLVDHADLDGALLLDDDPYIGIERNGGVIRLGETAGLGVMPRGG